MRPLGEDVIRRIQAVPDVRRNTRDAELDVNATFDYMERRYIDALRPYVDIDGASVLDLGSGFGWLAFAFLRCGGGHAVLIDTHEPKIEAAMEIAEILHLRDRCEFFTCDVGAIPAASSEADVVAAVEVLEHVGASNQDRYLRWLEAAARKVLILTTPNVLFPVDWHDTQLPFSHWLPRAIRAPYVRALRGAHKARAFNHYIGPLRLIRRLHRFRPVSRALTFETFAQWRAAYPFFSPYAGGHWKREPPRKIELYLKVAARLLGRYAFTVNPNLAAVWVRRPVERRSLEQGLGATVVLPLLEMLP